MKKKMVCALALCAAVIMPRCAMADTETANGITWTYTVSDGKVLIENHKGNSWTAAISQSTSGAVTIPSLLGGYPVTGIGDYAFSYCRGLTSVTIPPGVTNIGRSAFSECSGLTSVTIPDGVTSIGDSAFSKCSGLTSVTIPSSVTSVGYSVFFKCAALTHVTIPSSVTSIGEYAFYGCNMLSNITIPSSVTSIGYKAFSGCSVLGSGVVIVDGCVLTVNGECPKSVALPYGTRLIAQCAFEECSGLVSIAIPSSMTSIGYKAFYKCSVLSHVTIPSSVTSIDFAAFSNCSGLTDVSIPSSVTSIGTEAFCGCCGLTSVTLFDGVMSIGDLAFSGCSGLTQMTIPSSVTNLADGVFNGCSNLGKVNFEGKPPVGLSSALIPTSCEVRYNAIYAREWEVAILKYGYATATPYWPWPMTPSFSSASGTVFDDILTITLTSSDGATIHYTLDGCDPTEESKAYTKKFRINTKTTVKAIAFYENGRSSEVATAEYALGTCDNPVISVADGTAFSNGNLTVSIAWTDSDGVLRYTLDGSDPTEDSAAYLAPLSISGSATIKAKVFSDKFFDSQIASVSVTKIWTIGDTLNAPSMTFATTGDTEWERDENVSHDGVEAMRSGAIGNSQLSELRATLEGTGILSFWLKVSCEDSEGYYDYDRLEFYVDDKVHYFDGERDWTNVVCRITSDEPHTLRWVYVKDDAEYGGDDCVWLDEVAWSPCAMPIGEGEVCRFAPEGLATPLTVSNDWLIAKGLAEEGDYASDIAAKMSANGKNGIPRYQSYILGMEPDSDVPAEEQLKVTINGFDENGAPVIEYKPTPNDATHVTVKKLGRKTLPTSGDTGWTEVNGNEADFYFFKVKVEVR